MNNVELLKQYKELFDEGAITQEEYDVMKKEVLDEMSKAVKPKAESPAQSSAPVNSTVQTTGTAGNESTIGWAILGFLIPIVGLILFLVWKDSDPAKSKSSGKGALIGVVVGIVGWVIISMMGGSYYY